MYRICQATLSAITNNFYYNITKHNSYPHLLLKWTLKNLPPRREHKVLTASMAAFHLSLINAIRKAKELCTLLLNPAILAGRALRSRLVGTFSVRFNNRAE